MRTAEIKAMILLVKNNETISFAVEREILLLEAYCFINSSGNCKLSFHAVFMLVATALACNTRTLKMLKLCIDAEVNYPCIVNEKL